MGTVSPILSDAEAARRHWHKTAERILELFKETHGRDAKTIEELEAWAASPKGGAILDRALKR